MLGPILKILTTVLIALSLSSCQGPESKEEEIGRYIADAASAFAKKDTGDLKKLIAEEYKDGRNFSRQDIGRILAGYFLRNPEINVLTSLESLQFLEENDDAARISIYVAVSRIPLEQDDLDLLDATFYKLEGRLVKNKKWLLQSSELFHATADDFISAA
jgi:hypothetical protein